jgi:hypothetical protein
VPVGPESGWVSSSAEAKWENITGIKWNSRGPTS